MNDQNNKNKLQCIIFRSQTVLAFLPSMIQQQRAYIIGVTPTVSIDDAFMGTRAAIAGNLYQNN